MADITRRVRRTDALISPGGLPQTELETGGL